MNDLIPKIKALAADYKDDVVSIRRHLHRHPELSFEEFQTAEFIESKLQALGFSNVTRIGKTGVTVMIDGTNKNTCLALRADIDALPIHEKNEVDYKSQNEGIMHACGHDVHTASLLGCARILLQLRSHLKGSVKIIFQPGEEKVPGGASVLIGEGILKNPTPKAIIGQHVMPHIPAGKIGFRAGKYMASADEIYITIHGEGGHAARPESNVDPIAISAQLITALQQVISRNADPKTPSVLSFGKISGPGATNVIPDHVELEGTFRTFDENWRNTAHGKIKKMAIGISEAMGARCEIEIRRGYPYLENDESLTSRNMTYAAQFIGKENIVDLDLWMAGEDFAFYTQHVPGCFYRLGTGNPVKGITSGVHTPTFDIDEDALELGMGMMTWLAINSLNLD